MTGKSTVTLDLLVKWLEEDGHAGCASDLALAPVATQHEAALAAATCMEEDAEGFHDGMYAGLIAQLREWAAQRQGQGHPGRRGRSRG